MANGDPRRTILDIITGGRVSQGSDIPPLSTTGKITDENLAAIWQFLNPPLGEGVQAPGLGQLEWAAGPAATKGPSILKALRGLKSPKSLLEDVLRMPMQREAKRIIPKGSPTVRGELTPFAISQEKAGVYGAEKALESAKKVEGAGVHLPRTVKQKDAVEALGLKRADGTISDIDLSFGKGDIYKKLGVKQPSFKFDKVPETGGAIQADIAGIGMNRPVGRIGMMEKLGADVSGGLSRVMINQPKYSTVDEAKSVLTGMVDNASEIFQKYGSADIPNQIIVKVRDVALGGKEKFAATDFVVKYAESVGYKVVNGVSTASKKGFSQSPINWIVLERTGAQKAAGAYNPETAFDLNLLPESIVNTLLK